MGTNPEMKFGPLHKVAAIAAVSAFALGACGSDKDASTTDTTVGTLDPTALDNPLQVTDDILADGNFACGGKFDKELNGSVSTEDFSYKFDFYTAGPENMELATNVKEMTVTNPTWGMGQEAFDILLDNMYINPNNSSTRMDSASNEVVELSTEDADFDKFLKGIFSRTTEKNEVYVNGDCRNNPNDVTMPSTDIPSIELLAGNTVEGVLVPKDVFENQMLPVMNKDENGNIKFRVDDFNIVDPEDSTKVLQLVFITTFANGCDNVIRITSTPPEMPPTGTTPPTGTIPPTDTVPPVDTVPPNGRKGTPATTLPATQNTSAPNPPEVIGDAGDDGTPPSTAAPDETPDDIIVIDSVPEEDEQRGTEEPERDDEPQPNPTIAPSVTTPQYEENDGSTDDNNNVHVTVDR